MVRETWRTWKRSPLAAAVVMSLVALGIGGVVALFGPLRQLLARPLPYPEADRLVRIGGGMPLFDRGTSTLAARDHLSPFFEHVAAYVSAPDVVRLETATRPLDVTVAGVTSEFLDVLALSPRAGHGFDQGMPDEMLISERLWETAWSSSTDALGARVRLGSIERTIVGVLSRRCDLPPGVDVWIPMAESVTPVQIIGRLRRGVPLTAAADGLRALKRELPPMRSSDLDAAGPILEPLQRVVYGDQESMLRLLLAVALLFLLLACAGISSLLVARGVRRRSEIAVRLALGASRARLAFQLLVDTCVMVGVGGALGLACGALENRWLNRLLPDVAGGRLITPTSVSLVACLCLGVTMVGGFGPALQAARTQSGAGLQIGTSGPAGRLGRLRLSSLEWLACVQLILAIGLTISTGMLVKALIGRVSRASGIDTAGVVVFRLQLPRLRALVDMQTSFFRQHGLDPFGRYGPRSPEAAELEELAQRLEPLEREEDQRNRAFFEAFLDRVAALPGVLGVAAADPLPFTDEATRPILRHAYRERPANEADARNLQSVTYAERRLTPEVFTVLRMQFVTGRGFTRREVRESTDGVEPAVVGEVLARELWPDRDPTGRHFFDSTYRHQEYRVVGVVASDAFTSESSRAESTVYIPLSDSDRSAGIIARLEPGNGLRALSRALGGITADMSPRLPEPNVRSLDSLVRDSERNLRAIAALVSAFAGLGVIVASLAVYGIVTFAVALREREMAVRLALGASIWSVRVLTLRRGLRLAAAAIPAGVLLGWLVVRILAHSMTGQLGLSVSVYALSTLFVFGVAVIAGVPPTLRLTSDAMAVVVRQEGAGRV
jgi:ABC-type antimicrobial peptide transport system permease subunit